MNLRTLSPRILSIWLCFIAAGAAQAAVYYVDPAGSDANPGTQAQPWQTITKAANTLVAGDTVYIMTGTYNEQVIPINSGTAGNTITYAAYPGAVVTIDGTGVSIPSFGGLVHIESLSNIRLSGLRVINAGPGQNNAGILVDMCQDIMIDHNYTYNTVSSGIGIWNSQNVILEYNEVNLANNDGEQECISVATTDNFDVRYNYVHDGGPGTIGGEGICIKDGASNGRIYRNEVARGHRVGIYLDAWDKHTFNIDVYQNVVHDVPAEGIAITSEAGGLYENAQIRNNIVYNNTITGIVVGDWGNPGVQRPVQNVKIINNTTYNNGSTWGGGITIEDPWASNIEVRNNIASQNVTFQIALEVSVPGVTVDSNLIDGFRGYAQETKGTNFTEADPQFQSTAGFDFHLKSTSPAIDAASATNAPADDYDGNLRPQGAGYDIGAYEDGILLSPAALPQGYKQTAYSQTITATGGTSPYTFSLTSGTLPAGLTLSTGGILSGTPTTDGSTFFTVQATDSLSNAGAHHYRLDIMAGAPGGNIVAGMGLAKANPNEVKVFTSTGLPTATDFFAYAAGSYGVNVASGDYRGTANAQILTGPGPGAVYGPQVRGFDRTGTPISAVNFFAYGTLRYGVNVQAADLDTDAFHEILSGAGEGAVFGPHVRGWNSDGGGLQSMAKISYFAYGTLRYGVKPAGGEIDGDAYEEILTGPGPGIIFGPQIRGWDYDAGAIASIGKVNFNAFTVLQFGANLDSGDVEGDSFAEIVCSPGPGTGANFPPRYRGFDYDGSGIGQAPGFDVTSGAGTSYGGRVGLSDLSLNGQEELLAALGPDPAAQATVETYTYNGTALSVGMTFNAFTGSAYGANVMGGDFGF